MALLLESESQVNIRRILEDIHKDPNVYTTLSPYLKHVPQLAHAAVKKNEYIIAFVPPDILNYKEIVLESIKQNAGIIKELPHTEYNNEFVLAALIQQPSLLSDPDIQDMVNKEMLLELVRHNKDSFSEIPIELMDDDIYSMALRNGSVNVLDLDHRYRATGRQHNPPLRKYSFTSNIQIGSTCSYHAYGKMFIKNIYSILYTFI